MKRSLVVLVALSACKAGSPDTSRTATSAEAAAFVGAVDAKLRELWVKGAEAAWTYSTDVTDEHAAASAAAEEETMAYTARVIKEAARFNGVATDPDVARKLHLIKLGSTLPAPDDAEKRAELARLGTDLSGIYAKGKWCSGEDAAQKCMSLGEIEGVLANDRSWDGQLAAWKGWHEISREMRPKYQRFVELGNEGAREIGFKDLGDAWRSGYDMPAEDFEVEVDRLWDQVKPLYDDLHCYVRSELSERYGEKMPADGTIPAHVLGNMWAQSWENLYPILEPYPGQANLDITPALVSQKWDHIRQVQAAEGFFTSIGLDPLPKTFWERSLFLKPADREVECHASAWDVGLNDDLRIKMCIRPVMEDFTTIHHELGHNYYYHYYYQLPVLYQSGAHDGFHEGIGDTIQLSITPAYLQQIGLLEKAEESPELLLNKQMQDALTKVAFLPFGRMIDQWRWEVFSGRITPEDYNAGWWRLRQKYQGVSAPEARGEDLFDPGAKYHIPGNTPYMRYFLAHILQFQFHEALCEAAGHKGPLHTCSIYGNKAAGERLKAMLAMGASRPWPDALEKVTGTRQMNAESMLRYFQPLQGWLKEQNKGKTCGW